MGRKYRFNWNSLSLGLIIASITFAIVWWYYPGTTNNIAVTLENGEQWQSSHNFPQSLYTIDMNPDDSVNAGVWFYVENNMVHALNTLVKILCTFTVFYISKLKVIK